MMARYRKIDSRIQNDEKFRDLSDDAQLVFFLLLSHPHMTALGAMRATVPGLAAEKGWADKRYRKAFGEPLTHGMVKHDAKASFLWLPNFLKYNPPESPNVVRSWQSSLDLLPECEMKRQLIHQVKVYVEGLPKAFGEALPLDFIKGLGKDFAKSMPNQEQEQEQEQDKELEDLSSDEDEIPPLDGELLWPSPEAWVEKFNASTPNDIPKIHVLTPARQAKIKLYLRIFSEESTWDTVFVEYNKSSFLQGLKPSKGHEHFKGDADWLLSKGKDGTENVTKVLEGKYRDTASIPADEYFADGTKKGKIF